MTYILLFLLSSSHEWIGMYANWTARELRSMTWLELGQIEFESSLELLEYTFESSLELLEYTFESSSSQNFAARRAV